MNEDIEIILQYMINRIGVNVVGRGRGAADLWPYPYFIIMINNIRVDISIEEANIVVRLGLILPRAAQVELIIPASSSVRGRYNIPLADPNCFDNLVALLKTLEKL
jgi:hypothetical protein